jgi:dolichol-phosphate mannosyltransferase
MDGDLQDPPEAIPKMIERWRAGAQVVYAVRRKRKEGLAKRLLYAIYYRLMQRLSYITMPLDSGDFSLMDRRIASAAPYARAKQVSSRSPSLGWLSAGEPRV